ncbi:DUF1801 domain-containing protein [Cryomorpha ignava]|uniref:DUF1801 domain-containing protein n=1 Tax=Cryomorpha ignava TaxID=101383 RepID=A0A7K3WNJ9_9FLAO|nr:DUF1801 domain-containing protein [Cryomorpha ignava]NEN23229.1 DUF1801 domain-containing protein [Cryomorpha ignava]
MESVKTYIDSFPKDVQKQLNQVRQTILQIAPLADEDISYKMPAYKLNGKPLVYFAGFKNHIGFYATPSGHKAFAKELSFFKQGKGSVQFPLDKPMPLNLIARITRFRVDENEANKAVVE